MDVNQAAPVIAAQEIDINASAESVWAVLSDIGSWSSWNPAVRAVQLTGPVAEGTRFRWKAGPGTITSMLRQVDRPRVLAWTGRTLGISAVHVYRLEPGAAGTVVHTSESWSGALPALLRAAMTRQLQQALRSGLDCLKREVERRENSGATDS